jgi:HSP20 family protein
MLARMLNDFAPLMRQVDELFEGVFEDTPAGSRGYGAAYPALNVWEDGQAAWVEAELPGMGMDDIEIYATGDQLTIRGQRKITRPANGTYRRRERAEGQFARTITLPWDVEVGDVEATFADGVLTVKLPKCESCKPKKIAIKALPSSSS